MAKINILDSSIFNLISAGEVVDKPMSVVKELVENSIDAGAKHIEVEIKNGGMDLIRVTDDGCGIEKDEIAKAFMSHATSKISCVEDLNSILTLGFRGEALASIAAVAKVTLTTRTADSELGNAVIYDGGILQAEYECGSACGTTVVVENIFEKIPARQKYLRSASSEEADIANLMTRLILANPDISIKFSSESKNLFSTGENEKSALIAVYGNDILSNVEEMSLVMPDITIRGFVGKPSFSKHSRNYQTLVVNGRYVKNEEISYMVYLCYKDFLMSRQYPMYVIYIDIPADMVDVNVHPNKMDVKFVQPEKIKKQIKALISEKLGTIAAAPKQIESYVASTEEPEKKLPEETVKINFSAFGGRLREAPAYRSAYVGQTHSVYPQEVNEQETSLQEKHFQAIEEETAETKQNGGSYDDGFLYEEEMMTVGTLFSTYIIVEKGDECFLIDQHAAHERILYDKFVKLINEGKPAVQSLLLPYDFELSYDESELLDKNLSLFEECGFEIEKHGKSYSICAVPAIISDMRLSEFIPKFFEAITMGDVTKASLIKDTLAQSACKAAVKGDRLLSFDEIKYLIKGINSLDALLCPHGRPIVIKITKYEVDKWFKRK